MYDQRKERASYEVGRQKKEKRKKERINCTFYPRGSRFRAVVPVLDYGDVGCPLGRLFAYMAFKQLLHKLL